MSQTDTHTPLNLDADIIEHQTESYPAVVAKKEVVGEANDLEVSEPKPQLSKREQARLQRASLLAEQEKLQKLLDDIEDDSDEQLTTLQVQVRQLREEVDRWTKPDDHHVVFAHIGIFCLVASLICWFVAPVFSAHSGYLDGAVTSAAVVLAYAAAGLLLFVQTQKH